MITVIIAGGSGTRLWPLSTPSYPKHLLRLTNNRTSIQNTYDRAKQLTDKIYIVTEASHSDHIFEQLPDLTEDNVIIEAGRRGTSSCVIAALDRIMRLESPDEPIAFMHADHSIRDVTGFINTVQFAGKISKKESKIVLLGIEPHYPATAFGYIKKSDVNGAKDSFVYTVDSFKEKPDYDTATSYIKSGNYLWNMGYFVAPASVFLDKMQRYSPKMYKSYQKLQKVTTDEEYKKAYLGFENIAIDYTLMEPTPDLLVVPGSFDWVDIGSFTELHDVSELDEQDNHCRGNDIEIDGVENSYIRNESDRPLAVIGLDNVVVVSTPHGVLVTRKDLSQKVGEIAKKIAKKADC